MKNLMGLIIKNLFQLGIFAGEHYVCRYNLSLCSCFMQFMSRVMRGRDDGTSGGKQNLTFSPLKNEITTGRQIFRRAACFPPSTLQRLAVNSNLAERHYLSFHLTLVKKDYFIQCQTILSAVAGSHRTAPISDVYSKVLLVAVKTSNM